MANWLHALSPWQFPGLRFLPWPDMPGHSTQPDRVCLHELLLLLNSNPGAQSRTQATGFCPIAWARTLPAAEASVLVKGSGRPGDNHG